MKEEGGPGDFVDGIEKLSRCIVEVVGREGVVLVRSLGGQADPLDSRLGGKTQERDLRKLYHRTSAEGR